MHDRKRELYSLIEISAGFNAKPSIFPNISVCPGNHNDRSGIATRALAPGAEHCARISTELTREDALSVKSTGCDPFGRVNVVVTGLNVPGGNAGIVTFAFVAETTVSP